MNAPSNLPNTSRKAQALAFIEQFLTDSGHSPTIGEIAGALRVSGTRAKALVHALASDQSIVRTPGTQRGISVPGMARRKVLAELAAEGWKINAGERRIEGPGGFPKGHLPIVAVLSHIPLPDGGEDGGDDDGFDIGGGSRAAAGRAPGAGAAAAKAADDEAA